MLTIRCETARFAGEGRFRCHRCRLETVFHGECSILLMLFPTFTILRDAATGAVMHECERIAAATIDEDAKRIMLY